MKRNAPVTFIDASGVAHEATIVDIVGAGPSHYKLLDLTFMIGGEVFEEAAVPHANDRAAGSGFWLQIGEAAPESDAPADSPWDSESF